MDDLLLVIYAPFRKWMIDLSISGKFVIISWISPFLLALISTFMLVFEMDSDGRGDTASGLVGLFFNTVAFWNYKHAGCVTIHEKYKE